MSTANNATTRNLTFSDGFSNEFESVTNYAILPTDFRRRVGRNGGCQSAGRQSWPEKNSMAHHSVLLLAYLPRNKALWSSELAKKRSQNKNFKDDLLRNPLLYDTFHEVKKKNDRRKYTSSDEFEEYGRGRSNSYPGISANFNPPPDVHLPFVML
ncbi:hypothetical protein Tco_1144552 [Tanacetum coccineum]